LAILLFLKLRSVLICYQIIAKSNKKSSKNITIKAINFILLPNNVIWLCS